MVEVTGIILLVVIGILSGVLMAEAGLRGYYYAYGNFNTMAGIRNIRVPKHANVYDIPYWLFDKRYGYRYPVGPMVPNYTQIRNGKVTGCVTLDNLNERGNKGTPIRTDYERAAVKIAIFGSTFLLDPFCMEDGSWQTWPMVLERKLSERLGKPVSVVNFGRDGYGVAQMIALAAGKLPEWKPDLAIISFISNDLNRMRLWRSLNKVNGLWRYLVSPYPDPNPDPLTAYDTTLYNPAATREWCLGMRKKHRPDDPVFVEILNSFEAATRRAKGSWKSAGYFARRLDHSYLYQRLVRGDPFYGIYPARFHSIKVDDFNDDARLLKEAEAIRNTRSKIILFHMARDGELAKSVEYIANPKKLGLVKSLPTLLSVPIRQTTDYITLPIDNPKRLRKNKDNGHPSLEGQSFYAQLVADMLFKEEYLPLK